MRGILLLIFGLIISVELLEQEKMYIHKSDKMTLGALISGTEDQKSTLFSEGQLEFSGKGILTVKSNLKHAICSDDYIDIQGGSITVSGALKDRIHVI